LAGDSIAARRAFEQLVTSVEPGSSAHRVASRRLFALSAANPDRAEPMLLSYGALYPDPSDELAEMRVTLARSFVRRGRLSDAARVLSERPSSGAERTDDRGTDPRLAAELGRVRLFAEEIAGAVASLEVAANHSSSDPRARTSAIRLSAALVNADSLGAIRLGRTLYAVARDAGLPELRRTIDDWELHDPSPETMAIVADDLELAGHSLQAVGLRARLLDRYPDAPEAPMALLAIARYERDAARPDDGSSPSIARLERLILEYPESALAPLARRLRAEWIASPARSPDGD
jgi:hypothetical protein